MCRAVMDKMSELVPGSHNTKKQKLAAIDVCTETYLQESIHSATLLFDHELCCRNHTLKNSINE